MIYEWDAAKARANLKKHGVSFTEAATVFLNPLSITYEDPAHSAIEEREITIGYTLGAELLFVSHCQRGGQAPHDQHAQSNPERAPAI